MNTRDIPEIFFMLYRQVSSFLNARRSPCTLQTSSKFFGLLKNSLCYLLPIHLLFPVPIEISLLPHSNFQKTATVFLWKSDFSQLC